MDWTLGGIHLDKGMSAALGQGSGDDPLVVSNQNSLPADRFGCSLLGSEQGRMDDVLSTSMSFRDMHKHGPLLARYLETRKAIFIDRLKWQVAQVDGMEFDQYDTPACRWVVLHRGQDVLGGVRLLPTDAECGIYSYMLRDAQRGILKSLPRDVLYAEAPVAPNIWEASRFFVSDKVDAARRLAVQRELFAKMVATAAEGGATHILGIVPAIWARWSRRLGVGATPAGGTFQIDGTSSQSVLFDIDNPNP